MKTQLLSKGQEVRIRSLMHDAYLTGLGVATIKNSSIQASHFGYADTESGPKVQEETKFWACSLSKPVFAFLILKLIEKELLPPGFMTDSLDWDESILGKQGNKKSLTAEMILSHQTGLQNSGPTDFKFNPGEGYRYSGDGYIYLQKIIESKTGQDLDRLAQNLIFRPLGMTRSSFLYPEGDGLTATPHDESMTPNQLPKMPANHQNAAASLHTTPTDYARFLLACIQSPHLFTLMTPKILSMNKDIEAKAKHVDQGVLDTIDWGLGFGLEKDKNGKVVSLFHWGHGPGSRAFFDVKLKNPDDPASAVGFVYLVNHENGLAIANEMASITVGDISPIMRFLSEKYDYKDILSPHWRAYHDLMMAGKQSIMKGDFNSAISAYQRAKQLRPDKSAELSYRIQRAMIENRRQLASPPNPENFSRLAGQFGPIQIIYQNSTLQINDGGPSGPRVLEAIDTNTFLDGNVILTFDCDDGKMAKGLSCLFPNGDNQIFNKLTSTASIAKTIGLSKDKPAVDLAPETISSQANPSVVNAWTTEASSTENDELIAENILNQIWEKKISTVGENIETLKSFLKDLNDSREWKDEVNNYFYIPENRSDKEKFNQLFRNVTTQQLIMIDEGESLGVTQRLELSDISLDSSVESQIDQLMLAKGMAAAAAIGASGRSLTVASSEELLGSSLCIYSVTKILTGTLVLLMIRENILKETDLDKPLMLSDDVKKILHNLSPALAEHAEGATLYQAMTHHAGFGDFTTNYVDAILSAINSESEHGMPQINQTHDFLRFDDKQIHTEQKYSNTGSLLVGLAIEHAYYEKFGKHLSFDDILRKYLIEKVSPNSPISFFSKVMPSNRRYSADMPEAKHMVASPAGCYWTTIDDLRKIGEHLFHVFQDNELNRLLVKYGQEFTKAHGKIIYHEGAGPKASAVLYVSLTTGSVIATAAINSKTHAVELANSIERHVLTQSKEVTQKSSLNKPIQKR